MVGVLRPRSADEVADAVADGVAARRTMEIIGQGSRRALGRRVQADVVLQLSELAGVTVYEPNELVLTARAGTPLTEIEALLATERQQLAFEPPDFSALWGKTPGHGTVGGMLSTGFGGPRRAMAGGPRDHLLGFKAVNGFGEAFAAGGRVVKNVTGFDLPKLMTGAFGTLGVLTEVTLKVLPAPEASATLGFAGLDEAAGLQSLGQALAGPIPVTAAAHLPGDVASRILELAAAGKRALTCLRVEGPAPVVGAAIERLRAAVRPAGAGDLVLEGAASQRLWRAIGGAEPLAGGAAPVWRICAPPARAAELGEALRRAGVSALYYDWAGGLVWAEGPSDPLGGGPQIRAALAAVAGEGHATLIRGSEALREACPPFQPESPGVAALSVRIRAQFDPLGLLNPGRMEAVRA